MKTFCSSLTRYERRRTRPVRIGPVTVGGDRPVVVQSMTNTDTNDIEASLAQIGRIAEAGGPIVRLTAQGLREAESLGRIAEALHRTDRGTALVADIHFRPDVAEAAARYVDKVRINPGNYRDRDGRFEALLAVCRSRGVALRIGVNHGSLGQEIVDRWGDTPQGMVASAMRFLRICRERAFDDAVVSMKSSNTRVMVHAYRLLVEAMNEEGMDYPLHLGVTEAGNGPEGRIKSAVGIGALLADGLGDTLRVSLTEAPEREIPVALELVRYMAGRAGHAPLVEVADPTLYHPYEYVRRATDPVDRLGGTQVPLLYSELNEDERRAVAEGRIAVAEARTTNPTAEWRAAILNLSAAGDRRPVLLHRVYDEPSIERLRIRAAADTGLLFLDGLADGLWIENRNPAVTAAQIDELSLGILQASRARMSRTEYIACPSCGRTLYDIERTLAEIKARTGYLAGLKIGVMGCVVNGPGEMADADYGYVGAGPGRITLYRGREVIRKNIPQEEALDALEALIRADGRWQEKTVGR